MNDLSSEVSTNFQLAAIICPINIPLYEVTWSGLSRIITLSINIILDAIGKE